MTCRRGCKAGYLGTDEIRDDSSNEQGVEPEVTEGRIGMHLEFCARVGQKTRVRLCPCQSRGEKTGGLKGWRDDA